MKFRILLILLYVRMLWLSRFNDKFKQRIQEQDISIAIGLIDSDRSRYFKIQKGRVTSSIGSVAASDLQIRFCSAAYGYSTLLTAVKKPLKFAKGMDNRKIILVGQMPTIFWFINLSKYLPLKKIREGKGAPVKIKVIT
jgi:hypothetical protein